MFYGSKNNNIIKFDSEEFSLLINNKHQRHFLEFCMDDKFKKN